MAGETWSDRLGDYPPLPRTYEDVEVGVTDADRCPVCLSYGYCYVPDRCPKQQTTT